MSTRSAIASARSTRCSESTTAHCACSTAARNASAPSGSSCEVGSSSSSSCGSSASADARQTRCSSPPESSTVRRSARCDAPTSARAPRDPRPDLLGRHADVLETERDLVLDARHHDLVLGILEHRRDGPGELGGAVRARVEAADLDPAGEAAAVEMRHEPGERPQQRRLAAAGRPEQRDDLAGLELERDVAQGRQRRPGTRTRGRRRCARAMPPPPRARRGHERHVIDPASTADVAPAWLRCRPKPRASIASASARRPLERAGDERREQHRVPARAVQLDTAAAHRLGRPGRVALEPRHEARRERDGERRAAREAGRRDEPVVIDEQRVGAEREPDDGQPEAVDDRDPDLVGRDVERADHREASALPRAACRRPTTR